MARWRVLLLGFFGIACLLGVIFIGGFGGTAGLQTDGAGNESEAELPVEVTTEPTTLQSDVFSRNDTFTLTVRLRTSNSNESFFGDGPARLVVSETNVSSGTQSLWQGRLRPGMEVIVSREITVLSPSASLFVRLYVDTTLVQEHVVIEETPEGEHTDRPGRQGYPLTPSTTAAR